MRLTVLFLMGLSVVADVGFGCGGGSSRFQRLDPGPQPTFDVLREHGDVKLEDGLLIEASLTKDATDDTVRYLANFPTLQRVTIKSPQVTDVGLRGGLLRLTELTTLDLQTPLVTDDGVVFLAVLTNLQHLSLEGSQTTDAGLVHLQGLAGLKTLDLKGTRVTDAGLKNLQRALPKTQIDR
jgi:hypothetical protein